MAEHFIEVCSCGVILRQCRCAGSKRRTVIQNGCASCKQNAAAPLFTLAVAAWPLPEPSMLELRGAIDLLRSALKNLPTSVWRGSTYYTPTATENEVWYTIDCAKSSLHKDLSAMLGQNKSVVQAAALATVPVSRSATLAVKFPESPFPRY